MSKRNALIIGSSSGIGKGLTGALENDYNVISASSKQTEKKSIFIDLCNYKSLAAFFENLRRELKGAKIDLLILNSGVSNPGPILNITEREIIDTFSINTIHQIILTKRIIPLLNNGSKILFINSKSSIIALPFLSIYAATKSANLALAESLRLELKTFGISVSSIILGNTKTNIWIKNMVKAKDLLNTTIKYKTQLKNALTLSKEKYNRSMELNYVIEKITNICSSNSLKEKYYIGSDTLNFRLLKMLLPDFLLEKLISRTYGF